MFFFSIQRTEICELWRPKNFKLMQIYYFINDLSFWIKLASAVNPGEKIRFYLVESVWNRSLFHIRISFRERRNTNSIYPHIRLCMRMAVSQTSQSELSILANISPKFGCHQKHSGRKQFLPNKREHSESWIRQPQLPGPSKKCFPATEHSR